MSVESLTMVVAAVATLIAMLLFLRARAARQARDRAAMELSAQENRHLPMTLHPVIDPDRCIGSLSCLSVCPEGDVLGVVDGKAAMINASSCIGHGKCEVECPVDAISLMFGTSERGIDLPQVDEHFESSRPGVHIIGELGGMGLFRTAITQGLKGAEHLGQVMTARGPENDVVIVGAGAAGLAMAVGCKKAGLRFRLLEQDTVGGTIAHYPRQKVVMTEKIELPLFGKFGATLISKEQLLETWQKVIAKTGLQVESGVKVSGIQGSDGAFTVQTSKGAVTGRKVVLAIGRRGTPRPLGCKGDNLPKVAYRLVDPAQYEGTRVLVVGGGDAALEAAMSLAEETEAEVVLSYRQAELGKARDANKKKFREMVEQGRIAAFMPSQVQEVKPDCVLLARADGKIARLTNDYVIACLGGELPTDFLKACDISLERHTGEAGEKPKVIRGSANFDAEKKKQRRLAMALFVLGGLVAASLMWVGGDYYFMDKVDRIAHPLHKWLRPSGNWGHGVGIVATAFMLSNFLYSVRKRIVRFKGAGRINRWLTFHQFVGLMSPVAIVFHAAFQSNNVLASATAGSVSVVVATGLLGRFIYGLVPSDNGRSQGLGEITVRRERLIHRVERIAGLSTDESALAPLVERVLKPTTGRSLGGMLLTLPFEGVAVRRQLGRVKHLFANNDHADFVDAWLRLRQLNMQVEFFGSLKRLLSAWRVFHVVLAVVLVFMISAHIAFSLYLGYKWILA